jgi:hypothetical protein
LLEKMWEIFLGVKQPSVYKDWLYFVSSLHYPTKSLFLSESLKNVPICDKPKEILKVFNHSSFRNTALTFVLLNLRKQINKTSNKNEQSIPLMLMLRYLLLVLPCYVP